MSNKIVPSIYRSVIDDVIATIRPSFDEFGVSEDVLADLQNKWENKVIASHVAEFDPGHPAPHHPYPPLPLPHHYAPTPVAYVPPPAPPGARVGVKPEPIDPRYALVDARYALLALPGPQIAGASGLSFPGYRMPQTDGPADESVGTSSRIPQTDGPSEDDSGDDTPSPPAGYAPRTAHPSLPAPKPPVPAADVDAEAINSDLDDSDTENDDDAEDAGGPEGDIVFCTYDKVARVKNKWKCVLKDGMIHTGGKDYLFQRCTGEFEW
ncbi:transcription factor IIA, alpha/beta subunit-domain-containing protein [Mycena sp. CBHHK59/15]|nr:transcription factor IIA, alpha/beta subunit-domain-containing protein [Mycena sp. CBHHK59/15]